MIFIRLPRIESIWSNNNNNNKKCDLYMPETKYDRSHLFSNYFVIFRQCFCCCWFHFSNIRLDRFRSQMASNIETKNDLFEDEDYPLPFFSPICHRNFTQQSKIILIHSNIHHLFTYNACYNTEWNRFIVYWYINWDTKESQTIYTSSMCTLHSHLLAQHVIVDSFCLYMWILFCFLRIDNLFALNQLVNRQDTKTKI